MFAGSGGVGRVQQTITPTKLQVGDFRVQCGGLLETLFGFGKVMSGSSELESSVRPTSAVLNSERRDLRLPASVRE